MESALTAKFRELFSKDPILIAAPGRVNLIGEHTDYNQGFVLPAAVDKKIFLAIAKNGTDKINVFANQFREFRSFPVDVQSPVEKSWLNYLLGVTCYLQQDGKKVEGVDVVIDGTIPVGAGMSSSAALCSGYGFGLNQLFNLGKTRMELALIGQKTEHEFVGVNCGIMDEFSSLHGKAAHVIKLDCRSMEFEYFPFHFPDYKIVLVNTMVSHSLAGSEYNVRRQQCEDGLTILRKYNPEIKSLRDVDFNDLSKHKDEFPPVVFNRCNFIVKENQRLLLGCTYLANDDVKSFGQLMFTTHEGLSKEYEVSCKESDFLVKQAKQIPGVAGSRQMGGGFGGCTINLVKADSVERFGNEIDSQYTANAGVSPEIYITQIEDGVKLIPQE